MNIKMEGIDILKNKTKDTSYYLLNVTGSVKIDYLNCRFWFVLLYHNFITICDQIYKKGSYTRTVSRLIFHRHLLATYINVPTGYAFTTAKSSTVCFHSGPFLKPVWRPRVLG